MSFIWRKEAGAVSNCHECGGIGHEQLAADGTTGVAYMTGIADAGWTAIGLAAGTYLNWLLVANDFDGIR